MSENTVETQANDSINKRWENIKRILGNEQKPTTKDNGQYFIEYFSAFNDRCDVYIKKIEEGTFSINDVEAMLNECIIPNIVLSKNPEYNYDGTKEFKALFGKLSLIKGILAQYFGCSEEEIFIGNADFKNKNPKDYKVIIGDAIFSGSRYKNTGNIQEVIGELNLDDSNVKSIEKVRRTVCLSARNKMISTGELTVIDWRAELSGATIRKSKIERIGGPTKCVGSIIGLDSLESVGGMLEITGARRVYLPNLETIGGNFYLEKAHILSIDQLNKLNGGIMVTNKNNRGLYIEPGKITAEDLRIILKSKRSNRLSGKDLVQAGFIPFEEVSYNKFLQWFEQQCEYFFPKEVRGDDGESQL